MRVSFFIVRYNAGERLRKKEKKVIDVSKKINAIGEAPLNEGTSKK